MENYNSEGRRGSQVLGSVALEQPPYRFLG